MSSLRKKLENLKDLCDLYMLWKKYKIIRSKKQGKKKRSKNKIRKVNGYFQETFLQIKEMDSEQFFNHTRMNKNDFDVLLSLCHNSLTKTSIRTPVSPETRLALTLLYLSQGTSFQSIACNWNLGKETVRSIIYETCDTLYNVLSPTYVSEPNVTELSAIVKDFWRLWNVPNCIGAIDGKHIALSRPPNTASEPFNHSIVLLAACDAKYSFTFIDVGSYGSQNDGGVFQASSFGKRLLKDELSIPEPRRLPNSQKILPHFFVADTAFPLHMNIMKAFPGVHLTGEKEIYNKRISKATRVIENCFGILVARWRILLTTLNMLPENAEKIILACISLHNFLRLNADSKNLYLPPYYVDWEDNNGIIHEGFWRKEITKPLYSAAPSRNIHVYNRTYSSNVRNELCNFVNNEGAIM